MKNRFMLRCISVLLCAVLCCPLFACAAAEDTDRTLFDNTDYILDVSEIVMSAQTMGALSDRNNLKIYELPGENASVLFAVYCRNGAEQAVLFRYYERLSDLFWGKRTYYDGKVMQIEDAPEYGEGMKRLQVHMQGGFQDPDDYASEMCPSIWFPPQGGVREFDTEFIVDAEDHIIALRGIRELGTEDTISFGYDGDRITEIRTGGSVSRGRWKKDEEGLYLYGSDPNEEIPQIKLTLENGKRKEVICSDGKEEKVFFDYSDAEYDPFGRTLSMRSQYGEVKLYYKPYDVYTTEVYGNYYSKRSGLKTGNELGAYWEYDLSLEDGYVVRMYDKDGTQMQETVYAPDGTPVSRMGFSQSKNALEPESVSGLKKFWLRIGRPH